MSLIVSSIKMTPHTAISFNTWLSATMKEKNLKSLQYWLEWTYSQEVSDRMVQKSSSGFRNVQSRPIMTNLVHSSYEELLDGRCRLCFGTIHNLEGCHVYMSMTPNQRKIALTIYKGCFLCTKIVYSVHVGSSSNFCDRRKCWMPCETCQSHEHHFSICEASNEPFKAVLNEN